MRRKLANQSGMTLVEVVVAVGLFGAVLALATASLRMLSGSAERGERVMSRVDMTARGLHAVRHDLERIERVAYTGRTGPVFDFKGNKRQISFILIEPPFPTDPGSYRVTYTVNGSGAQSRLTRSRSIFGPGQSGSQRSGDAAEDVVVIEGLFDIAFSYARRGDGPTTWLDTWAEPRRMPDFIRLDFTSTQPNSIVGPPLIVRLRVDAEVTCLDRARAFCTPRSRGDLVGPASDVETQSRAATTEQRP